MGCNYSLNDLRTKLNAADLLAPIYYYVMSSLRSSNNIIQHFGSGPNWQGGVITLCTCKHLMRTYPDLRQGTWVAGFSKFSANEVNNFLIYLMRIGKTYESHYTLWYSLPEEVKEAKAADINPLGDVYRPLGRDTQRSPFDPEKYYEPCQNHSHKKNYDKDINYLNRRNERRAALFVGDVKYSFVWDQYMITLDHSIGRGQRKLNLGEFLDHLQEIG